MLGVGDNGDADVVVGLCFGCHERLQEEVGVGFESELHVISTLHVHGDYSSLAALECPCKQLYAFEQRLRAEGQCLPELVSVLLEVGKALKVSKKLDVLFARGGPLRKSLELLDAM